MNLAPLSAQKFTHKQRFIWLFVIGLLISSSSFSAENTTYKSLPSPLIREIESEGYYFKTSQGYYRAAPFAIEWEFGFNKLAKIPYFELIGEPITMIVYKKNWSFENTYFLVQSLDIVNHDHTQQVVPKIKPMGHDRYELTFPGLEPKHLLIMRDVNGFYCTSFGSISGRLEELFQSTDAPAHAVLGNLKSALKSFPGNKILKALLPQWQMKRDLARAADTWETIDKKWHEYSQESRPDSKQALAEKVEQEIRYYMSFADELPLGEKLPKADDGQRMLDMLQQQREEIGRLKSHKKVVIPTEEDLRGSVSRYRAYSNNLTITLVNIGDEGDVLMRFNGIPNKHNGKVYRHKKELQNEATGAFIYKSDEINGENWNTFNLENDGWGGERNYVYPPDIEEQVNIHADNDEKEKPIESAQDLLKDYVERIQQK